jgi:MFS family permease
MALASFESSPAEWRAYWPLVLTGIFGMILAASISLTLGVMIAPLEQEFGWTRAQISSGPMLISITGVLLSTAAGYAIDRLGARKIGIAVVVVMTGSLALLAGTTDRLWHWWLLWGLFGIAGAATSTVWLAPISSLFVKGRGLAVAVTLTGTGIGGAIIPPFCQHFVEQGQWRKAYLALGLGLAAVTIPLVLRFWRGAEEFIARPHPTELAEGATDTLPGMTPREGFASPEFYKMFCAFTLALTATVAVVINLVPVLVEAGLTAREAAGIAGANGLAVIAGRLVGGWVLDRVGAKILTVVTTLGCIVLPAGLLLGSGSLPIATGAVLLAAFLGGVKYPAVVYLVNLYFGPRSFGTLYGTISIAAALAVGAGPLAANYVFDVNKSYSPVLWAVIPALAVAAALYASLGRPRIFDQPSLERQRAGDVGDQSGETQTRLKS